MCKLCMPEKPIKKVIIDENQTFPSVRTLNPEFLEELRSAIKKVDDVSAQFSFLQNALCKVDTLQESFTALEMLSECGNKFRNRFEHVKDIANKL